MMPTRVAIVSFLSSYIHTDICIFERKVGLLATVKYKIVGLRRGPGEKTGFF